MRSSTLPISDRTRTMLSSEKTTEIFSGIIDALNEICRREGLQYFAYANLLVESLHYGALLPYDWSFRYDVGMLREDFERFMNVVDDYSKELHIRVDSHPVYDLNESEHSQYIYIVRDVFIDSGDVLLSDAFSIRISPFDRVPETVDTRSGFYRRMKRVNRNHLRTIDSHLPYRNRDGYSFRRHLRESLFYRKRNSNATYEKVQQSASKYVATDSNLYQRVVGSRSKSITQEELFPLRTVQLGNTQLFIPNNCSSWTTERSDAFKERTEEIQRVDLELLREFHRVCEEIGVGYFLCGGSMLGYVRDGGFIPWDDDIDCGMLRADYQRFLQEADKYLDHRRFFLQTRDSDPSAPFLFSKIRRNNTLYVTEYNEHRKYHKGICLDIFPFDFIPNDAKEREDHRAHAKKLARRHHFIANRKKGNPTRDDKVRTAEDVWYRFLGTAHRHIYRALPLKVTQKAYDDFVQKYNEQAEEMGLDTVGSFVPTYTYAKLDTLLPYREVEFEGVTTKVPNHPERFLEMQYGDYMSLPLPHQRIGHELVNWDAGMEETE